MVRIVCKLNIFLIIIAMFIGVSANADDNTQHVWKYTPIPLTYGTNTNLVELTESDENFNTYTVKQTTTSTSRCLYVRTENPLPANHKYFINVKLKSNFTNPPYFRFAIDGDYTDLRNINAYEPNKWLNTYKILTPTQDLQFTGNTNGILPYLNSYVAGETITIDKNGFLTMFDLTEMFGAGNEPTTVAAAIRALSIDTTIKIATTKYSDAQFAPVENDLDDAVAAVDTVVTQTMSQAQQIDQIATNKQTRPNEGCDAKYCLLVEDEDGTPHWYPIAGANGVAHALPAGYTELQYIESTGTQYINTNITGSTNAIIDMQGTPITGNNETVVFMLSPINATDYLNGFGQYKSSISGFSTFDIATRRVYNVSYTSNSMTVNGRSVSTRNIANDVNLSLFGSDDTIRRIARAKLYSAKIYNNDALLRDFVPVKKNNVVGLYDMVSGQFFTNAGTGAFTAGPDM